MRQQLKKKLATILLKPRIEANRLMPCPTATRLNCAAAYRLVYQVIDQEVMVFVVAVDKREREPVYRKAAERLS